MCFCLNFTSVFLFFIIHKAIFSHDLSLSPLHVLFNVLFFVFVFLSVCVSVSFCVQYQSAFMSFYLCIHLSICLSISFTCLSTYQCIISLSPYPFLTRSPFFSLTISVSLPSASFTLLTFNIFSSLSSYTHSVFRLFTPYFFHGMLQYIYVN